jgi:hypothetical protein
LASATGADIPMQGAYEKAALVAFLRAMGD